MTQKQYEIIIERLSNLEKPDNLSIWGSWFSIVGLPLAIIGLIFTYKGVISSKEAAKRAEIAADAARKSFIKVSLISEINSVVSTLNELRRTHREDNNAEALRVYPSIRSALITIRESSGVLLTDKIKVLQSCLANISQIKKIVKKSRKLSKSIDLSGIHRSLGTITDDLNSILTYLKYKGDE